MLVLQNISYTHPDKSPMFDSINLTVGRRDKIAIIGNNGSGKSTLLKLIAGEVQPTGGERSVETDAYYIPQVFGQYDHLTVAQALRVDKKLDALHAIINGDAAEAHFAALDDDWTIEERCEEALRYWQLTGLSLSQPLRTLSGGQKTKVFLAGISIHQPGLILLDEPSKHLDTEGRSLLYAFVRDVSGALLIVSHDRQLLNLLDKVCELDHRGITVYGGNYDFYAEQKQLAHNALNEDIHSKEKALRKAREKEREASARQQKMDARGKGKQEKAGVARIMMNTLRNKAENSTSKLKSVHAEKIGGISQELQQLRSTLPDTEKLRFGFDNSSLHRGKILFAATGINFGYGGGLLWKEDLDIQLASGERIALSGANGSGKTTLINIIRGTLEPSRGTVHRAIGKVVYIDQDYSLIDNQLTVYRQAQQFNGTGLEEHEVKIRLNRFLFPREDWDKPCRVLSGGERMRLMLCCLTIGHQAPDVIILDEPTNNLDIQSIGILTAAINEYRGTLLVVSHDTHFLEEVTVERTLLISAN